MHRDRLLSLVLRFLLLLPNEESANRQGDHGRQQEGGGARRQRPVPAHPPAHACGQRLAVSGHRLVAEPVFQVFGQRLGRRVAIFGP